MEFLDFLCVPVMVVTLPRYPQRSPGSSARVLVVLVVLVLMVVVLLIIVIIVVGVGCYYWLVFSCVAFVSQDSLGSPRFLASAVV